jgi:hypothetical protein
MAMTLHLLRSRDTTGGVFLLMPTTARDLLALEFFAVGLAAMIKHLILLGLLQ